MATAKSKAAAPAATEAPDMEQVVKDKIQALVVEHNQIVEQQEKLSEEFQALESKKTEAVGAINGLSEVISAGKTEEPADKE